MVEYGQWQKVGISISSLSPSFFLSLLSHRNVHVRNTTSQFICLAVELYDPARLLHSGRDVERTLPAIIQLVGDSAPEAR